ncbi:MAG: hypothetical protein Q8L48_26485 [Archangium sp.]|nr:hypothetical protein [Archangium sp.]
MRTLSLLVFLVASGCVHPTYLRVATATEADFERISKLDSVWYEFQPGDTVPFNLLYFGAIEGGVRDIGVKAKSPFYLVAYKNQPLYVSYDGKNLSPYQIRFIVAVTPRKEGTGGQVNWMTYLGDAQNPEAELEKLFSKER